MSWDKNECIYIKWHDILSQDGWISEQDAATTQSSVCYSVGFYLNETEEVIRISSSVNDINERNVLVIPKGVIEYPIIQMKKVDDGSNSN